MVPISTHGRLTDDVCAELVLIWVGEKDLICSRQRDGKAVRVLAEENDKAFTLLDALDETQRKHAVLNYEVDDLVLGPGHAGEQIQPEGLKASAMNDRQRALLLNVISEWAGIVQSAYAGPRMEEVKADLNDTYFAWSGQ